MERKKFIENHFLILGAQKSGTTALFEYLSKHPMIRPSQKKEINFFSGDLFNRGIQFYSSFFPSQQDKGIRTFEASPDYLVNPDVPERIHAFSSGIKMIAILRDPATRAYSAWNMYRQRYAIEPEWFADWMKQNWNKNYTQDRFVRRDISKFNDICYVAEEELQAMKAGKPIEAPILLHGFYYDQLIRYYSFFNRNQFFFIDYNLFQENTLRILQEIEDFIKVPHVNWEKENLEPVFVSNYKKEISKPEYNFLSSIYKHHNQRLFELLETNFDWTYHKLSHNTLYQ